MTTKPPLHNAGCLLLASITLVACISAYGQHDEIRIKNTVTQIRPGVYECIVYFEISGDLSQKIEEVTYTLPYGYPNRKHSGKRRAPAIDGFFSSKPIVTAEEIVINIKIEYTDDRDDGYLSYRLNPFNSEPK